MSAISRAVLVLAFSSLVAPGCKGDKEKEGAASGGSEKASAGAPTMSAGDFLTDLVSLKGMEAMEKYGDGVVVSGTILRTGEEQDGSMFVHLDAGGGKWVAMTFTDKGAAAKAKGLAKDGTAAAKCKVGGHMDKYAMVIDCVLQ